MDLESNAPDDMQREDITEESLSIHSAFQTFVTEAAKILDLLSSLGTDGSAESVVCAILDKYQEQCQLLDPHLDCFIKKLFPYIVGQDAIARRRSSCILYTLCKVRGFKTVVKFFPHEVSDLHTCLTLLENENPAEVESWQTRYVLILWLSILVMVPFALKTVDSSTGDSSDGLIAKILQITKDCLSEPARTRDGAAYLLAIFLTRPDMESSQLVAYLQWCREKLSEKQDQFTSAGILSSLANIFKYGQRHSMLDKTPIIFDALSEQSCQSDGRNLTTLQRKLLCKLAQRLGLTYLPLRVASWRYERGCRSLLENLNSKVNVKPDEVRNVPQQSADSDTPDEDDSYVCSELDFIIDHMLRAMRDRDTVVRWSGAKGIGRLTGRLPRHLADEIVLAVLQQFDSVDGDQDSAWHGGCLALAELARRGLLLPKHLDHVVPFVIRALKYDMRKGAASVGAHVRDAACYVCWAFARAYAPAIMQPYVAEISKALIVAAVFDREINCRRAAAAAFQENVGRQGTFPHGIDILTRADYFTLGNRANAYLEVSIFIAQFPDYRPALIEFLYKVQLRHWDRSIRTLSAQSMRRLTQCDAAFVANNVLDELLRETLSADLPTRHGCALGFAEVILGLSDAQYELDEDWKHKIVEAVPQIEKARLYRGRGGEIMREASCRIIEALALAKIPMNSKAIMRLMESVDENLKHPTQDIQKAAVEALKAVAATYFDSQTQEWKKKLVHKYAGALSDPNPAARRGFALAFGSLNKHILNQHRLDIIRSLIRCAVEIEERAEDRDAESRRNALVGLVKVCKTLGVRGCYRDDEVAADEGLDAILVQEVFYGMLKGMDDYSVDHRGDVGSWVREASMLALQDLALMLVSADEAHRQDRRDLWIFTHKMCFDLICMLLKQLGEKIDRIRECAATVLTTLVSNPLVHSRLTHDGDRDLLFCAILGCDSNTIQPDGLTDWSAPSATFPRVVRLLDSEAFLMPVLSGLVISCGGLTESLVKHSWASLLQHVRSHHTSSPLIFRIGEALTAILKTNVKNDRVVLPVFNTLNLLLTNGCLDRLVESSFAEEMSQLVQDELRGCRDVTKLQAGASVLCGLIGIAPVRPEGESSPLRTGAMREGERVSVRERCLVTLLALLSHRFPKVRKHVAEQVYMWLLTLEDPDWCDAEGAMELLTEIDWLADVASLRDHRDRLYPLLGLPKPLAVPPAAAAQPHSAADASPQPARAVVKPVGYAELVKEMHY